MAANRESLEYVIHLNQGQFTSLMTQAGMRAEHLGHQIDRAATQGTGGFQRMSKGIGGIKTALLSVTALGGIAFAMIGKSVISVTSDFQKYTAVLTNSLGSTSVAKDAMSMVSDIAATTPFSVNELSESFVKLVNRGILPAKDEIMSLGDLAAASGKPFDQLTEAMLDAMTGENERLREFGIKAAKQGDKVVYTFKGQATEVRNNAEDIKAYLISLGQLDGVKGAQESISKTWGGMLSNLGDNWNQLLLKIGNSSGGIFSSAIAGLNSLIEAASEAVDWFGTNWNKLGKAFAGVEGYARPFLNMYREIWDVLTGAGSASSGLATAFEYLGGILDFLQPVFDAIGSALSLIWDVIKGIAGAIWAMQKPIMAVVGFVKNVVGSVISSITGMLGGVWKVIKGIFTLDAGMIATGIKEAVVNSVSSIPNAIAGGVQGGIEGYNKGFTGLRKDMGFDNSKKEEERKEGESYADYRARIKKQRETQKGAGANSTEGKNAATAITGAKPTNIYITIARMIGVENMKTENLQESSTTVGGEMLRALITALNNAQISVS